MDLCQKNETELENGENNQIPSTEEPELNCTYSDERKEKNHVCCLLNISDITLEQDEKANKFVIGTGWEEAVRGWGKTSPTACLWPRKKRKKAKVGEGVSGCLLCVSLSQGTPEAGPQTEAGSLESRALAEAGSEEDPGGPSQTQLPTGCPTTASRNISKMCSPSHSPGEKKCLQIKEFFWCMEEWAIPETGRDQDSNSRTDQGPSISNSLNSKALLVLPPLNSSAPHGSDVQVKKSKNSLVQPEEKVLSVEKDECVACAYGLKMVEGKDGKRPFELASHLKVSCMQPFPSPMVGTNLLANPELGSLHWSLLPKKNLMCPPNPNSVHCLRTMQLLQKQKEQSYKAKFKARELRPPMNTQKCILKEATQENRPHPLETNVFPRPLLPSLTVSRVVIPTSTHRFL
ncbi:PREDICTED: uncharacterized protein C16orf46 homolog isoform X2 [Myotis davidii]|uniref:uncharacterized protein C16orf46 homolog isoform X1 n=1 Tax=Myotis davidii TaxID=225400 RepID=UPI0003EC2B03|nr:PREDICTED: uncharacterized protein C16orf46 homolog isoform X1 [Myotis davidii]XP_006754519.1 PREDICTED: uncharacterized protein C16orf46 homolog isoform X1 [Myotis davidii]XP_015425284.1 PREDICTED: uncharacterized protein C16orf46 homolog isoform X2 [Myotis davidii]